mgnify:CR=1 FL=1
MAYADFNFYKYGFGGDKLSTETAPGWLEAASDMLDSMTFSRLTFAFPTLEVHAKKVKKAVCAIADALYLVDVQRSAASAQKGEDGKIHGAVASISSGKESISYSNNNSGSVYSIAAANQFELRKLLYQIVLTYLAGVPDANGINLLYGGLGDVR